MAELASQAATPPSCFAIEESKVLNLASPAGGAINNHQNRILVRWADGDTSMARAWLTDGRNFLLAKRREAVVLGGLFLCSAKSSHIIGLMSS